MAYEPVKQGKYISPLLAGEEFEFVSAFTIYPYLPRTTNRQESCSYKQYVYYNNESEPIFYNRYGITNHMGLYNTYTGEDVGITLLLKKGIYRVEYIYTYPNGTNSTGGNIFKSESIEYTFAVVENRYPMRKQTIEEVVNRILELAEPLCVKREVLSNTVKYVKPPRFQLAYKYAEDTEDGKAERALFRKSAPEFTFTHCTLREALQQVGQFIHAEPRLRGNQIIFDRYGESKQATYRRISDGEIVPLNQYPYKSKRFRYDGNSACTRVESEVDNFVNRLDGIGGTVTEPYDNGAMSLRTDTAYGRFEDSEDKLYFPTLNPIMDVTKFEFVDLEGIAGEANKRYDITPYVFEKTIYDSQLSSYDEKYPYSKAYGLYFIHGEKHIRGLFFKNEKYEKEVFSKYAILNILQEVTGKKKLTISSYPKLCFCLTYTPIYGGRVSHGKSNLNDMLGKPFVISHNQSANVVETRYYGENMKGVAERLGNEEQTVDISVQNVENIPKIGEKWDEDFYVSTVTGSVLRDRILLSLGLTKKFNRLSEYVGANSYKRYYEVSERMAQERNTLYRDYLVITMRDDYKCSEDCLAQEGVLASVYNTFYQIADTSYFYGNESIRLTEKIVRSVESEGYSRNFTPCGTVILPVASSAFGNVMEFTWSFKDNYSAGIRSSSQTVGAVSGYFGEEVPYCDYYGVMYYQKFVLQSKSGNVTLDDALAVPKRISSYGGDFTYNNSPYLYHLVRKDNREILNQSYSVEFVTDIKGLIIGSALAKNNPAVSGLNPKAVAELYVLPNRVNQFSNNDLDLSAATKLGEYAYVTPSNRNNIQFVKSDNNWSLWFKGMTSTVEGKAWAILTKKYNGNKMWVQGESGEPGQITPHYGGEILIARNCDVKEGDTVGRFFIVPTHDLFEFRDAQP